MFTKPFLTTLLMGQAALAAVIPIQRDADINPISGLPAPGSNSNPISGLPTPYKPERKHEHKHKKVVGHGSLNPVSGLPALRVKPNHTRDAEAEADPVRIVTNVHTSTSVVWIHATPKPGAADKGKPDNRRKQTHNGANKPNKPAHNHRPGLNPVNGLPAPGSPVYRPKPHNGNGNGQGNGNRPHNGQGDNDKPHRANPKPQGDNDKPHRANPKPQGNDDKPHRAIPKPQGDNDKPHRANSKPQGNNDKPHPADPKPQGNNDKPHHAKSKPQGITIRPMTTVMVDGKPTWVPLPKAKDAPKKGPAPALGKPHAAPHNQTPTHKPQLQPSPTAKPTPTGLPKAHPTPKPSHDRGEGVIGNKPQPRDVSAAPFAEAYVEYAEKAKQLSEFDEGLDVTEYEDDLYDDYPAFEDDEVDALF